MKSVLNIVIVALFLATKVSFAGTPDSSSVTITTQQGILHGTANNDVRVWRGIPYAQPPVGDLRFKAPQPVQSWEGIRNATAFGSIAPQPKDGMSSSGIQSEDCLFLNIWSPKNTAGKKPVMFWIHGGGFVIGAGSDGMYEGSKMSKNGDVVVVTINYRLGPLGFLYLDQFSNDSIRFDNNLGLRDQVAALKWVNENIEAFGGDPANITIFGESAGANSVLCLLAAPSAKGLFQKAIVQSAAAVGETSKENAIKMTNEYLKFLNLSADNISELFKTSTETLLEAGNKLFEKVIHEVGDLITFAPVYGTDFLPLPPSEAIAKGFALGIPVMIGTNKDEANLFAKTNPPLIKPEEETINKYMNSTGKGDHLKDITSMYPGYPSPSSILSMITDGVFQVPAYYIADAQSNFASAYSYRFDWTSFPIRLIGLGACHGMELPFVFSSFNSDEGKRIMRFSSNRKVRQLSKVIQKSWTNFAYTGSPDDGNITWTPYNTLSRSTMIFNNTLQVVSDPIAKLREGWGVFR